MHWLQRLVVGLAFLAISEIAFGSSLIDCNSIAGEMNKSFPKIVDNVTRLTNAGCYQDSNRVVLLLTSRLSILKKDLPVGSIETQKELIKNGACSSPTSRESMKLWDVEFQYFDSKGIYLYRTKVRPADCR